MAMPLKANNALVMKTLPLFLSNGGRVIDSVFLQDFKAAGLRKFRQKAGVGVASTQPDPSSHAVPSSHAEPSFHPE